MRFGGIAPIRSLRPRAAVRRPHKLPRGNLPIWASSDVESPAGERALHMAAYDDSVTSRGSVERGSPIRSAVTTTTRRPAAPCTASLCA
jgi:hypothetical protein